MSAGFEAGIGPKQILRLAQWGLGFPIAASFFLAMLWPGIPDPVMWLVGQWFESEWWGRVFLLVVAALLEFSDMVLVKTEGEFETKVHEIVKGIGDRLRAGAATETAVAEAVRGTSGPSSVFARAIELSDTMPFDAALRQSADECGSAYLREVAYLVSEAVANEGDTGAAIRRLGMELERNHQYATAVIAKISNPVMVMRVIGLFAVPPLYTLLRWSFGGLEPGAGVETGARWFFLYGAVAITMYDWLIFGQWERIFARMPLGLAAVWCGLHWI